MIDNRLKQAIWVKFNHFGRLHINLSGFWNNLASHLGRSALNHSYGYFEHGCSYGAKPKDGQERDSAADRPSCFASLPQNSGSW